MPINNTSRTAGPFLGNGVNKVFPFSYKVFTRQDLLVAVTDSNSVEKLLTLDSDFTVTLNSDQDANPGGIITTTLPPAVGTTLAATSNIPITQTLDLTNNGGFYPKVISNALDRLTIQLQQVAARVGLGQNVGGAAQIAQVLSFITSLTSNVGAKLVGFLSRTIFDKLFERPSVLDYGAKGDGVKDDSDAILAAIAARKNKRLEFPAGTYRITKPLTFLGKYTHWLFERGAVLDFHLADDNATPITCIPEDWGPYFMEGATINCNYKGMHAIKMSQGAPKFRDITINAPNGSAFYFDLNSARFDWIENLVMENVLVNGSGDCMIHVYMTGLWNGTPFFNETFISQIEARGIGTKVAGGNAIRFTFDGTDICQVTGFTMLQSNFDGQQSGAAGPLSHVIHGKSINGGTGRMEGFFIKGGGWESTGGVAPAGLKNIQVDPGITFTDSSVFGIVNYNWAYGVGDLYTREGSNYYIDANGAYLPDVQTKPDGSALRGKGGYIAGFSNSSTAYRYRDFLVKGGSKNIDIPFFVMGDYEIPAAIYITIFHKGYPDSLGTYGEGFYLVTPSRTLSNFVQWNLKSFGSGNASYSFDPNAVTFSIPQNGVLRVTIPGGTNVGTSGANTAFDISASRMGVDLPGIFPALPI